MILLQADTHFWYFAVLQWTSNHVLRTLFTLYTHKILGQIVLRKTAKIVWVFHSPNEPSPKRLKWFCIPTYTEVDNMERWLNVIYPQVYLMVSCKNNSSALTSEYRCTLLNGAMRRPTYPNNKVHGGKSRSDK